jgi:aspartate carbamoyltransferase catalytic subunit
VKKDLLGIGDLTRDEIYLILDTAEAMREIGQRPIKKVPTLRGKTVVNLFYEPSTRTRTSFEIAEKRLSADTLNVAVATSSVLKGETLVDTALNIEAMAPDFIVLRHASSGAGHLLSRICRSRVINAGDGMHEHPTQALLDGFTMREHKGRIEGLKVAIIGDLLHSRVLRSNVHLLNKLGASVWVCSPRTLMPPGIDRFGVTATTSVEEALRDADVVMMLRIQLERQQASYFPSVREYARLYGLDARRLEAMAPHAIVMHPGPMNRGVEIAAEVADSIERSVIASQVTNGINVRMALLYLLLGGPDIRAVPALTSTEVPA